MTYVFRHFVLEANVLCLEELLEGLLFLAVRLSVFDKPLSSGDDSIPVDVAELVFAHAGLQADRDIECPAGRHGTADSRHGDDGNVLNLNVRRRLRNEDQTLVQEV